MTTANLAFTTSYASTQKLYAVRILGALGISLFLHAIALSMHFKGFDAKKPQSNPPPLEVVLVNSKSASKPNKADALAQSNLDGGGNTDADRRAKSPLPVTQIDQAQTDAHQAQARVEMLEQEAQRLLTQIKARAKVKQPQTKPDAATTPAPVVDAAELVQKSMEMARLEAQIARETDQYNKRPKRHFVGARTQEYRFARYVEDWRAKVERIGNNNYPEAARAQKLYGQLQVTVSIKSDGTLEDVEVSRSSGHKILDAAAIRIVQLGAPYAAFPDDIRRDTDILSITRTWMFTREDEFQSRE